MDRLWISDAYHYIVYCNTFHRKKADALILKTLISDITNFYNGKDFVPMVSGYTRRWWTKYIKWQRKFK